jgi:hypothetical protein
LNKIEMRLLTNSEEAKWKSYLFMDL